MKKIGGKKIEKLFSIKTTIILRDKMSNINIDFVQANQPSFFVHFAYANVTEEMVSRTLEELNLGTIREISFKPATNKKNERGNSIVVHFDRWFRNPTSDKVRQKLISGESIKINYNPKAYLQVIAFQPKAKPAEERPKTFKKPTITFDDDEDDFGPKLGPNCSEKFNTPKVKCDEREPVIIKPRPQRPQQRHERPQREDKPRPKPVKDERPQIEDKPKPKPVKDERPKRPTTPEGPPPTPEPKAVVYNYHNTRPDVFDLNEEVACRGVLLPPPKRKPTQKKPINFQDSPSDSDSEDEEINFKPKKDDDLEALYGDISNIDLNK
ncbi:MAG: hypothetical protein RLZZ479_150 [Bacteroidota bacterium]